VLTVLVLLRKEANAPALSGVYERRLPDGRLMNRYDYQVVRLWQEPVEPYLTAGAGLVPLAPLTDVAEGDLPGVVRRMAERINPLPRARADKLWTAAYLLMGLPYPEDLTTRLFEGVQTMQESVTYQKILKDGRSEGLIEGRVEEARRLLLELGAERYHEPDAATLAAIAGIRDIDRLEALCKRILNPDVHDWSELLGPA
jgi:predicted transposase YdaD